MEIEKRYELIDKIPLDLVISQEYIEQMYSVLSNGKNIPDVRIRKLIKDGNTKYFHTVKYPTNSKISRIEIEDLISEEEYNSIFNSVNNEVTKKNRYIIPINNGLMAEVDEFITKNKTIVEVEFKDENDVIAFENNKPLWIGKDITNELKFVRIKLG